PTNILYYRDGVSTGQFEEVLTELEQIRKAYIGLDGNRFQLKLIALFVVKRHLTCVYSTPRPNGKVQNCQPGTLVDSVITSPLYSDFYLQSHHALDGTAIPTHYFVLESKMDLSLPELQNLTYQLCHTYVRSTAGVSYAPPAYYADRLCER
ncbi:hypothetical protein BU23DRAFT_373868, partial [Bimuria novae-zelandiae CBS 107.79]